MNIQYPDRALRPGMTLLLLASPAAAFAQNNSGLSLEPGLDLSSRVVFAESAIRDDDDGTIDGDAVAIRVSPSLDLSKEDVTVTFRNSTTRIEYFADERTDRWQNVARLGAEFAVSENASFLAFGERGDNIFTAESASADEWEMGGRFELELDQANRVRLGGSWRERSYDDAARSSGQGPQLDAEYRYRIEANHFVTLRGRYEEIDSANPLREMSRWSLFASYQRQLTRDLRIRPEIAYRDLDFPGRILAADGYRRDNVLTPEVTLLYLPGSWQFSAEARYIIRSSSDPEFDRSGYRLALEVSHEF